METPEVWGKDGIALGSFEHQTRITTGETRCGLHTQARAIGSCLPRDIIQITLGIGLTIVKRWRYLPIAPGE
jgi:hypothetical protein